MKLKTFHSEDLGISGVVPELTRRLFDLVRAGRIAEAMTLQYRLLELFDAMLYSADFPEGFRAGVELRGFAMGRSRQPLGTGHPVHRHRGEQRIHRHRGT